MGNFIKWTNVNARVHASSRPRVFERTVHSDTAQVSIQTKLIQIESKKQQPTVRHNYLSKLFSEIN